jgi:hypothetical protein
MSNTSNKEVHESLGSWLNRAKQWAGGVGKGALSGTVLDKGEDPAYNTQVQDQLQQAEILQSAIFDAGSTIDSVLRSLEGTALQDRARESGSEMISFLQQSIKTVQSIIGEAGEQDMTNKSGYQKNGGLDPGRMKQLEAIKAGLDKMMVRSGDSKGGGNNYNNSQLDTWCREFLGKNNEGFESNEYLSTGNSLVSKANAILAEIRDADKMDYDIAQKDVDKVIKRGLDKLSNYIKGGNSKKLNPKPGSELEDMLIDIESEKPQSAAVQKFREDLKKLRIENSNNSHIWSEDDNPCAEEAATIVSAVTKKKYKTKEKEGFKELQRDTDSLIKNQPRIKELILPKRIPKI